MFRLFKGLKNEKGQSMTEYILIVVLIAIATLAVVRLFGGEIRNLFHQAANALRGVKP